MLKRRLKLNKRQKLAAPTPSPTASQVHSSSFAPLFEQEKKHTSALTDVELEERMKRINDDFRHGFELLQQYDNTVTFFGSTQFDEDNPYYQQARQLAKRIVDELSFTVVSGGGPGIMEAANRGAHDAKGNSVGMTIELPHEQVTNKFVGHAADFYYFFSRKVALAFAAKAYIYFPGGFGTLDEFFEIVTLKQTGKIPPIPIVLIGSDYWQPLLNYINDTLLDKNRTVEPKDTRLYTLTDNLDEVIKIIANTA